VEAGVEGPAAAAGAAPAAPAPVGEEGGEEIFVEQPVLRRINAHLADARLDERFGFLLGSRFSCPDTGRDYSIIELALPAREPFVEETQGACLLRAWAASQEEFLRHDRCLLGWYHSHSLLGLFLSEADVATTARYFGHPGQCALVAVPDQVRPLGGVFQLGTGGAARRGVCIPFFELLGGGAEEAGEQRVSALPWRNYMTDEDVLREVPGSDETAAGGTEAAADGTEATAGVGIPAAGRAPTRIVLPGESTERILPLPKGRTWGLLGWMLVVPLVAFGVWQALRRSDVGVRPASIEVGSSVSSAPASAEFSRAVAALQKEIDRYRERQGDFDHGRIGCDMLVGGYRDADRAFVALAQVFSAVTAAADSAAGAAYERLSAEMEDINRHFDGSGCTRPQ